jgi:(1->4)-alpha-D-glucan 1-alpha-D-glucosylmutase
MAIGRWNPWWQEVLALGPAAPHARHFDLWWEPDGTLLLPLLGRPYAEALAEGELRLVREGEVPMVAYWDERFPLSPETRADLEGADLSAFEADPDALHAVLERQHYRLAWWQLSRERISHRRFFTITELAGVRQEDPAVFEDTHRFLRSLVGEGLVDGVRVDHVDGLRDPAGYLARLRSVLADVPGRGYVVVEKILAEGEQLPPWPVDGTTGYDYLDRSGKLFVDPGGLDDLSGLARRFAGAGDDFTELIQAQQRFIMRERLGPETARFAAALERLARDDRMARDVIPSDLREALVEFLAALPVYRTYVRDGAMSRADREAVEAALETARRRMPDRDRRAHDFVRRVFLFEVTERTGGREEIEEFVERVQQFTGAVMAKGVEDTAFYQHHVLISLNEVGSHPDPFPTDPVAAYHEHNLHVAERWPGTMTATSTHDTKRSEDVRARIGALSQVAASWAEAVESWHARNRRHRGSADAGSVPTRNEELFLYQTVVGSWPLTPDDLDDYADRLAAHLLKAAREAKVHTEWLEPDLEHEQALVDFARGLVGDEEFADLLVRFSEPVWRAGALDSLAQLALRLAAPGVPDVYRGSELWDLSLTDPDNRRPVDWAGRRSALAEVSGIAGHPDRVEALARSWEDGRIKLHVLATGLRLRRERPELSSDGDYLPLAVEGPRAEHVVAFARRAGTSRTVAVVPRLTLRFAGEELWARDGWDGTSVVLPDDAPGPWTHAHTGVESAATDGRLDVADLFARFPVALLTAG